MKNIVRKVNTNLLRTDEWKIFWFFREHTYGGYMHGLPQQSAQMRLCVFLTLQCWKHKATFSTSLHTGGLQYAIQMHMPNSWTEGQSA